MSKDLFSIPIFFILFRETTEAAIIVSVLLSFLAQVYHDNLPLYARLRKQVWIGTLLGLLISLCIGGAFIAVWYTLASDLWGKSEKLWEGCFSLVAVVMITVMGLAMLRTQQMQEKWKVKLSDAMNNNTTKGIRAKSRRYALLLLPLITVLREGLEGVVFIGGISISEPASSIPIAAICGILCGCFVGWLLFRGGNLMKFRWFFVASTCILFLVAAGLFSRAIGFFEGHVWANRTNASNVSEDDSGGITFDVRTNVWYLTCCNPENPNEGGWQIFNAILGWNNVASLGTILGYILYWLAIAGYLVLHKLRNQPVQPVKETRLESKATHTSVELGNDWAGS
ncbi:iron permease FTR1 [Basidiobolus meristosporus CBS 931.73]|uniref:Iron permease FTR1 n=1 Tax=Basidiobolus meristosporus CBS 931.73 TaxID=1314790 RepID=A0A1Y1XAB8_9FUNG|nr:iron permease FTR1 [Basidiobolus meristosporus CBS 931.73]|eukprot:ORX82669.1 iron permease FTR1 [Basidiobolus meristosporus CBS 931.73]